MELKSTNKVFGGEVRKYQHASASTGGTMTFSVYVPPAAKLAPVPVVYYLSGLTCTDDNAVHKGGAFKACAEAGIMMVFPDTSPRGAGVAGEDESWDLGTVRPIRYFITNYVLFSTRAHTHTYTRDTCFFTRPAQAEAPVGSMRRKSHDFKFAID